MRTLTSNIIDIKLNAGMSLLTLRTRLKAANALFYKMRPFWVKMFPLEGQNKSTNQDSAGKPKILEKYFRDIISKQ